MANHSDGATHLRGVTFEISYPSSPFYPAVPVSAQFSGVMTADGELHVKLDGGVIPAPPVSTSIPVRGTFAVGTDRTRIHFSGVLRDDRIKATARRDD